MSVFGPVNMNEFQHPQQSDSAMALMDNTGQGSAYALTRVMSPTANPNNPFINYGANQSLLLGFETRCQACNRMTAEPSLCAECGMYGHAVCLRIAHFQGYTFCAQCFPQIAIQYAEMNDALLRQQWQSSLLRQVTSWKEQARNAVGASASIGIAVGGLTATTAGAVMAVAHGFV